MVPVGSLTCRTPCPPPGTFIGRLYRSPSGSSKVCSFLIAVHQEFEAETGPLIERNLCHNLQNWRWTFVAVIVA